MRLTPSDLAVLSTLIQAGPMHGYDLAQKLAASDVEDWAPTSRPQIYYSLKKLAAGGYLATSASEAPSKGPDRIVYTPTPEAEPALRAALSRADWVKRDPPAPFTTWSALALSADEATVKRQIKARRKVLEKEIARENATLKALSGVKGRDVAVARVMVNTVLARIRSELQHLDDLQNALLGSEGA